MSTVNSPAVSSVPWPSDWYLLLLFGYSDCRFLFLLYGAGERCWFCVCFVVFWGFFSCACTSEHAQTHIQWLRLFCCSQRDGAETKVRVCGVFMRARRSCEKKPPSCCQSCGLPASSSLRQQDNPPTIFLHQSQHICRLAHVHGRKETLAAQAGVCLFRLFFGWLSVMLQCHWRLAIPFEKKSRNTLSGINGATVKNSI